MNVFVIPGKYSNPLLLTFNWTLENFNPGGLQLRLYFDHPDYISSLGDSDLIGIEIYSFYLFADYRGNYM